MDSSLKIYSLASISLLMATLGAIAIIQGCSYGYSILVGITLALVIKFVPWRSIRHSINNFKNKYPNAKLIGRVILIFYIIKGSIYTVLAIFAGAELLSSSIEQVVSGGLTLLFGSVGYISALTTITLMRT